MEVTVHSIYDRRNRVNIDYGLDDNAYSRAMHDMNMMYFDRERYEYFGCDMDMDFGWHMTDDQYKFIHDETYDDGCFGWVAVGHIIVEFRSLGAGHLPELNAPVCDVYVYGQSDPFDYTIHGVPYRMLDKSMNIPQRRTKEGFQKAFEQVMISFLNDNPELIDEAIKNTVTTKEWN